MIKSCWVADGAMAAGLVEPHHVVPQRIHGFGVDVKLQLLQPGKRVYQHAERVKVFRGDQEFVVDLREDPKEIQYRAGQMFLSKKDYEAVLDGIRKYRILRSGRSGLQRELH